MSGNASACKHDCGRVSQRSKASAFRPKARISNQSLVECSREPHGCVCWLKPLSQAPSSMQTAWGTVSTSLRFETIPIRLHSNSLSSHPEVARATPQSPNPRVHVHRERPSGITFGGYSGFGLDWFFVDTTTATPIFFTAAEPLLRRLAQPSVTRTPRLHCAQASPGTVARKQAPRVSVSGDPGSGGRTSASTCTGGGAPTCHGSRPGP